MLGTRGDHAEILHDALAKAWEARARGACPRDLLGWLFVIVLNTARDQRRRILRRAKTLSLEDIPVVDHPLMQASPSAKLEEDEALSAARSAIHALPEAERRVFLLRTSAELSFVDTATALEIPVGTAKTRMRSALRKLRAALRVQSSFDRSNTDGSSTETRHEGRS